MNWTKIYLDTFIPELPKFWNANFSSFKRYLDIFYDENKGAIIKPVETTGRIKGDKGEFVTAIVDNLVVRNQYTNLYQNTNTADLDYINTYNGADASLRIAHDASIWPAELNSYSWFDLNKSYVKINNDSSIAFQNMNLGQEFQLIFNVNVPTRSPYNILMQSDQSGPIKKLKVDYNDASTGVWIKLINVAYDPSYGPTWVVKQSGGNYTIS